MIWLHGMHWQQYCTYICDLVQSIYFDGMTSWYRYIDIRISNMQRVSIISTLTPLRHVSCVPGIRRLFVTVVHITPRCILVVRWRSPHAHQLLFVQHRGFIQAWRRMYISTGGQIGKEISRRGHKLGVDLELRLGYAYIARCKT